MALASCFDLHVADRQMWVDRVRLAVDDHLLCLNNAGAKNINPKLYNRKQFVRFKH